MYKSQMHIMTVRLQMHTHDLTVDICLSVRLSVRPSVRLSVRPSVHLSVRPSVRLSNACIVTKRNNNLSIFQHRTTERCF